jgi:hypothetical protein
VTVRRQEAVERFGSPAAEAEAILQPDPLALQTARLAMAAQEQAAAFPARQPTTQAAVVADTGIPLARPHIQAARAAWAVAVAVPAMGLAQWPEPQTLEAEVAVGALREPPDAEMLPAAPASSSCVMQARRAPRAEPSRRAAATRSTPSRRAATSWWEPDMAHYAKVEDGIVTQVIVAEADFIATMPGTWVQTSYNTRGGVHYDPHTGEPSADQSKALRFNYAGIHYSYDAQRDAFIPPKPTDDAVLDEATCLWVEQD